MDSSNNQRNHQRRAGHKLEPWRFLPWLMVLLLAFVFSACTPQQPSNAVVQVQPSDGTLAEIAPEADLVIINTATGISQIALSETDSANGLVNVLQNLATDTIQENDFFVFNYGDKAEHEFLIVLYNAEEVLLEQTVQLDLSSRQYLIVTEDGGKYSLVVEEEGGELISGLNDQQGSEEAQDNSQLAADLYAAYQQAAAGDTAAREELFSLLPQITDWAAYQELGEEGSDPLNDLLGWLWQQRDSLSGQELTAVIEIANTGLDGAYAEGVQALYYDRFSVDPLTFLTAMSETSEAAQEQAADLLAAELYYHAETPWQDDLPDLDQQQQAALEHILAREDYWLERRAEDTSLNQ